MATAFEDSARAPRRLRTSIALAAAVFVSVPMLSAYFIGHFDEYVLRREKAALASIAERVVGEAAATGTVSLDRVAREERVWARRLDARGAVVDSSAIDPASPDDESVLRHPVISRYFFGPEGPPSLAEYETWMNPPAKRDEVMLALAGAPQDAWRIDHSHKLQVFHRAEPWPGGGVLLLARARLRGPGLIHDVRWQLFTLTIPLALGGLCVGLVLGWAVVAPIERMQRSVRRYLEGVRPAPIALERDDEIGQLSRDFEELIRRLEAQLERTTHAATDLTHELKNPITAILMAAEMLPSGPATDPERLETIARVIRDAGEHLHRTAQAMLDLARLEERLPKAGTMELDLLAVARRIASAPRASSIAVEVRGAPAAVRAIGDSLDTLVENLLENALAFAKTRVEVVVEPVDGQVRLTISDDGPGVSEGNRDKIWKRFFTTRASDGGSGLGLSIVRAVAEAHRGEVELLPASPLGGAAFQVKLPQLIAKQ